MKQLHLDYDYKAEAAKLVGTVPLPSHVDQTIHSDTTVIAPDGSIPAIFISQQIDPKPLKRAYRDWRQVNGLPTQRLHATGALSLPQIKKDGTLSGFKSVPKPVLELLKKRGVGTDTLGYKDGHQTPLTKKHPEWLDRNRPLVELVNRLYKRYAPTRYAKQRTEAKKIPHIRHTASTTIYISKKWQTRYHYDDGNLHGVFTGLVAMGDFTGGELVLPRWRIAFALKPGDLLLFDPQQLHGNLSFKAERLSAAFYCASRVADCGK